MGLEPSSDTPPVSWLRGGLVRLIAKGIESPRGAIKPCDDQIRALSIPTSTSHCASSS